MTDPKIVTLATATDAHHFRVGEQVTYVLSRSGRWVRQRWYHRFAPSRIWRRITWWRQPRMVTTEIDTKSGCLTLASLRWSWLRWKWVRE